MSTSNMLKTLIKEEEKIIAFIIESVNFVEITILPAFKKEMDNEVGDLLPATYKFLMNSQLVKGKNKVHMFSCCNLSLISWAYMLGC